MYEASLVPRHLPGGGGWSCKAFSLQYLYEAHQHCRNIWTKGNHNLPLVKYLGCKFKLYQSAKQDYVFYYQNFYPMIATIDSYCAAQPSLMLMHKKSKKVPSKQTCKRKRPYITVRAKPPAQMTNKWYFAQEIANIPLILTYCSACSLDNYYIHSDSQSTNTTIYHLKTGIFTNTNFENKGTTPYWCTQTPNPPYEKVYLYASSHDPQNNEIEVGHLICLGNTKKYTGGYAFSDPQRPYADTWAQYKTDTRMWGNPFYPDYLNNNNTYHIWQSTTTWATLMNETDSHNKINLTQKNFTPITELYETLRYSPERDTGENNSVYFISCTKDTNHWDPPQDTSYTNHGFPLWILLWGYSDFVKRMEKLNDLETKYCLTIRTTTTYPIRNTVIPLSHSFILGNSPFETEHNPLDDDRWYPSLQMQYEAINEICKTGPGTPKLHNDKTTQAKMEYIFYFKFGGSPPTMSEIEDPSEQQKFPIPNNLRRTTTIENPTTSKFSYIYNFDTTGDIITLPAAERIKKYIETKKTVFTDAKRPGNLLEEISIQPPQKKQKTEEETLYSIIQQFQQQQYLKRRIHQQLTKSLNLK